MKYFETKHEKDSAKLTALISAIILLLLFVVGAPYMDPPIEYGVVVNFGNTDFGSGNVQPLEPVKSEPNNVNEPFQPETTKSEPAPSSQAKEEVLTQENEEAIAIKKQKEGEAREKAIPDAKAKEEAEKIEKEKKRQEEVKRRNDALIGGIKNSEGTATGSEGNDNKAGDKGQLDGIYASSTYEGQGTGNGGVGYGLSGRGKPQFKKPEGCVNEYGLVVIEVVVNRDGNVIEATPGVKGTTNITDCLRNVAKKFALSVKWPANSDAPTRQKGYVTVNFTDLN